MTSASNWRSYSTRVPGKWVLAGEHTVLRGGSAIALPHPSLSLTLEFRPSDRNLEVDPDLGALAIHELLRIARDWLARRGTKMEMPRGSLRIQSTIPFSAGLGSSAALSVGTARWVLTAHSLDRSLERELAREMENKFHGKSSGMDVAAVSIGEPILFSMRDGAVGLGLRHLPEFRFYDTGLRAGTRECIECVESVRANDPARAERLDSEMRRAVETILDGLRGYDESRSASGDVASPLAMIAKGMDLAESVFGEWGLVPEEIVAVVSRARADGALAARVTGAGQGGYVVGVFG